MPAWLAFSVIRLLEEHFPRQVSYEFTALMEDVLDEIAAGRKDRNTELGEFYYGSGDVVGLHTLVNGLGEIDAKELATFPVGGEETGIVLRVGRYGPYIERPTATGTTGGPGARQRARRPAARRAHRGEGRGAVRQPGRRGDRAGRPPRDRAARDRRRTAGSAPTSPRCCPRTPRSRRSRAPARCSSRCRWTPSRSRTPSSCSRCRASSATDEDGEEITAQNGRYGPYLKKGTDSRSLTSEDQLFTITLDEALKIYAQPKQRGRAAAAAAAQGAGQRPGLRAADRGEGGSASASTSPTASTTPPCARTTRSSPAHPRAGGRAARRAARQGSGEEDGQEGRQEGAREEVGRQEDRGEEDHQEGRGQEVLMRARPTLGSAVGTPA